MGQSAPLHPAQCRTVILPKLWLVILANPAREVSEPSKAREFLLSWLRSILANTSKVGDEKLLSDMKNDQIDVKSWGILAKLTYQDSLGRLGWAGQDVGQGQGLVEKRAQNGLTQVWSRREGVFLILCCSEHPPLIHSEIH